MNNKLIEKIITCCDEPLPQFTYSNPLLDKDVAKALSQSFVKLLHISKSNNNENNSLRHTVLENIRKVCKIEPEGHVQVNEDVTELLTNFYEQQLENKNKLHDVVDKQLDAFLVRRWKEANLNTSFVSNTSPEVAQALINLEETKKIQSYLIEDIIHWNQYDEKYLTILKSIWQRNIIDDSNSEDNHQKIISLFDDTSIKFKPEIEKLLLEICHYVLADDGDDIDESILSDEHFVTLLKYSSVSTQCFQMCISILNYIFIKTKFNLKIEKLIRFFIINVKQGCKCTISILYPTSLSHLATLLDFDFDVLPQPLKEEYIQRALKYLKVLKEESETDLIMLLSHYPQWCSVYFEQRL